MSSSAKPGAPLSLPDESSRLRCGHCGNLTRFDVQRTTQVRQFWHVDLAGEVQVDGEEVLQDEVERITCRWCSASDRIQIVARPAFGGPAIEAPGDGGP
ncbi:MAG: hypothetical protein KGN78_01000 [Actinomycetales bacterium]|nr:hypothetical protein [Actinomycetales bacterium]